MAILHEASKLRFHSAQIHLGYDGSIRISTNADILDADGTPTEMRHGYTHRVSPYDPHWRYLAEALRPAVRAHHEALGLRYSAGEDPSSIHLHPQGHPHFDPPPLGEPAPLDYQKLRAHIMHQKEQELGTQIPPSGMPRLEEPS